MVEYTTSIYDDRVPPLVPATYVEGNDDVGQSTSQDDETNHPKISNDDETTATPIEDQEKKTMVASGTAGAVIGLFLGGPILSALLGFGAAYCTKKEGTTGDAARALGDVAVSARQKAEEFDDKHKIVDRSKKVANDAWQKAKTYDQSHNVLDTVLETIVYGWGAFVGFVKEHRLLEKGVDGVGRGYEFVAERVSSTTTSNDEVADQTN